MTLPGHSGVWLAKRLKIVRDIVTKFKSTKALHVDLNQHVASVHKGKNPFKCVSCG